MSRAASFFPTVVSVRIFFKAPTGVWISFSGHSPNWRVVQNFHSPGQKTTGQKYRKGKWEGKKSSPDWRVGLYFHSPILNSTCIWRFGDWLSAPLHRITWDWWLSSPSY
jgi:hypothetical protein